MLAVRERTGFFDVVLEVLEEFEELKEFKEFKELEEFEELENSKNLVSPKNRKSSPHNHQNKILESPRESRTPNATFQNKKSRRSIESRNLRMRLVGKLRLHFSYSGILRCRTRRTKRTQLRMIRTKPQHLAEDPQTQLSEEDTTSKDRESRMRLEENRICIWISSDK